MTGTQERTLAESEALNTQGAWVLGHTQKQKASSLHAGARAILLPSEITRALSTIHGRIAAQTMHNMGIGPGMVNYAAFRPFGMMEAIRRTMAALPEQAIVVDPAGGYAPQFIWLAEEFPQARFIEMDQPRTAQDKLRRLHALELPRNWEIRSYDLTRTPLHKALGRTQPNILLAQPAYVRKQDYLQLLHYLRQVLAPTSAVIAAFPYAPGIENMARDSLMFRRLAGNPIGMVRHTDEIQHTFESARYQNVRLFWLSEMAEQQGKPVPADIEVIAVAER